MLSYTFDSYTFLSYTFERYTESPSEDPQRAPSALQSVSIANIRFPSSETARPFQYLRRPKVGECDCVMSVGVAGAAMSIVGGIGLFVATTVVVG